MAKPIWNTRLLKKNIRRDLLRDEGHEPELRLYDADGQQLCFCKMSNWLFSGTAVYTGTVAAVTISGGDFFPTELDEDALLLNTKTVFVDMSVAVPGAAVKAAIDRHLTMQDSHYWSFHTPEGLSTLAFINERWRKGWKYVGPSPDGIGFLFERI